MEYIAFRFLAKIIVPIRRRNHFATKPPELIDLKFHMEDCTMINLVTYTFNSQKKRNGYLRG